MERFNLPSKNKNLKSVWTVFRWVYGWSYGKLGKSSRESVSCFIFRVASRALLSPTKVSFFTFAASTLLRKLIRIYGSGKRFYFRVDHRPQKRTYRLSVAKRKKLMPLGTARDRSCSRSSFHENTRILLRAKVPLVSSSSLEKCNFFIFSHVKRKIENEIFKSIEKLWRDSWNGIFL